MKTDKLNDEKILHVSGGSAIIYVNDTGTHGDFCEIPFSQTVPSENSGGAVYSTDSARLEQMHGCEVTFVTNQSNQPGQSGGAVYTAG